MEFMHNLRYISTAFHAAYQLPFIHGASDAKRTGKAIDPTSLQQLRTVESTSTSIKLAARFGSKLGGGRGAALP